MRHFALLFFLFFLSSAVDARSQTLADYIDSNCLRNCVDELTLLRSTVKAADEHDLDFRVLIAIVKVESGFRLNARSPSSVGLAQINLKWHRDKFNRHPLNPMENVRVGAVVLNECLIRNQGRLSKAFRCYNGLGAGQDKDYVTKVQKALSEIRRLSFV